MDQNPAHNHTYHDRKVASDGPLTPDTPTMKAPISAGPVSAEPVSAEPVSIESAGALGKRTDDLAESTNVQVRPASILGEFEGSQDSSLKLAGAQSEPAKASAGPVGTLPNWMLSSQAYTPAPDNDAFLTKSILGILGVLSRFQLQSGRETCLEPAALCKLFILIVVILMTSLASNFAFVLVVLALVLARVCLLPTDALKETVITAFLAALLTFAIMLPAILLGQLHSFIVLPTKVFISVALALTVSITTPFNKITASLRTLHVPSMIILTLDLTLKYIVMLGGVALETLDALRCRSVGKNSHKGSSLGGVIGSTFIKSQELSQETYEAMLCRGFTGTYDTAKNPRTLVPYAEEKQRAHKMAGSLPAESLPAESLRARSLPADLPQEEPFQAKPSQTKPLQADFSQADGKRSTNKLPVASTVLSLVGLGVLFALFLVMEGIIAW